MSDLPPFYSAVKEESPYDRMKTIVRWYLSGFYKKPKGLKKPYNPILGETFRCYWENPSGSKTHYIAEQVGIKYCQYFFIICFALPYSKL